MTITSKRILSNSYFIFLIANIFLGNSFFIYGLAFILLLFVLYKVGLFFPTILFYFLLPIVPIELCRIFFYGQIDLDFFNLNLILILSILVARNFVVTKFQVFISFLILILGIVVFDNIQDAIPYSDNHFIRLVLPAFVVLNLRYKSKYLEVSTLFLLLWFSFYSSSRSAILVSIFLLVFYFLFIFLKRFWISFIFLVVTFYIMFLNVDALIPFFIDENLNADLALKLTNEGTGSFGRESILEFVLARLSYLNLFVGFEQHFIFKNFGFEAHNSFLELFSYYGILILVLFLLLVLYMSIQLYSRSNFMLFILFLLIFIRSFFDNFLFINNFDFTFWLFVLFFSKKYNNLIAA